MGREYQKFSYKGSNFRLCSTHIDTIIAEIKQQRSLLEKYIDCHPQFLSSLTPLPLLDQAPQIARLMHKAATQTGIGPMAAVAGTIAQLAAKKAVIEGAKEAIVENGGDIYLHSNKKITIGIYAGDSPLSGALAFRITPNLMPCAVCSSSSKMGHSLSLGNCDLATVIAKSAPLADAAATLACNLVKKPDDLNPSLEKIMAIQGIDGVLLVKNDKIGFSGDLPELVKHTDHSFPKKITRDINSG